MLSSQLVKINPRKQLVKMAVTNTKHLKILFAEDNRINQILIQRFLNDQPCNVTLVENGVDAGEVCKKVFDVVLMDVVMPKMGGRQQKLSVV